MLKLKDFLLVLVVGYSVYQVYWGTGWNEQNLFLLICSLIAFGYSVLQNKDKKRFSHRKSRRTKSK